MADTSQPPPDRLTGWKEIAAYLDRGIRTVQRWEKEAGLPVRRVGPQGGESVFALRSELDAWLLAGGGERADSLRPESNATGDRNGVGGENGNGNGPGAPPAADQPRRQWTPRRLALGAALATVVLVGLALAASLWSKPATRRPAAWELHDTQVRVLDAAGNLLWSVENASACDPARPVQCQQQAAIADIDGDGQVEVLVAKGGRDEGLFWYGDDSRLRSSLRQPKTVTYGDGTYAGPYYLMGVVVDDQKRIWAWGRHHIYYPSFLWRIKAGAGGQLEVMSEYWSPGTITAVLAHRFGGRDTLLVGAYHNDDDARGASLAVFFDGRIAGTGPASSPKKHCLSCDPGGPDLFFTFPRSPLLELPAGSEAAAYFSKFEGVGDNAFTAVVEVGSPPRSEATLFPPARARYAFDGAFGLTHVELSDYDIVRARFEARDLHPRDWTSADLLPIDLWRNGKRQQVQTLGRLPPEER
jgi:hypothetical protein